MKKKKYKKKNTNENNGGRAICLGESKRVQYKVAYLTLATKRERLARERSLCYDPLSPPPSPSFSSFLFFHCTIRVLVICTDRPRATWDLAHLERYVRTLPVFVYMSYRPLNSRKCVYSS